MKYVITTLLIAILTALIVMYLRHRDDVGFYQEQSGIEFRAERVFVKVAAHGEKLFAYHVRGKNISSRNKLVTIPDQDCRWANGESYRFGDIIGHQRIPVVIGPGQDAVVFSDEAYEEDGKGRKSLMIIIEVDSRITPYSLKVE
jgi:hypothetical protein